MELFRDQGEAIHGIGECLLATGDREEAGACFQRARKIAEAHGFFHVEGRSCMGLGSNQPINQPINQPSNRPTNQPTNQTHTQTNKKIINQPTNQPTR